jgi:hypothetical protein
MITPRDRAAALLTPNGNVLEVGGTTTVDVSLSVTEKFNDQSDVNPAIPLANIVIDQSYVTPDLSVAPSTANATCGVPNQQALHPVEDEQPNSADVTYAWTIMNGTINSGQGTHVINFSALSGGTGHVSLYCVATSGLGIPALGYRTEPIAVAPSIVTNPASVSILATQTATFNVTTAGLPTPTPRTGHYLEFLSDQLRVHGRFQLHADHP